VAPGRVSSGPAGCYAEHGGESAGPAVLVVGAGPSGLFSAVELARHGVPSRVVERRPRPHRQARATALQPGTLEILYQAGLLDQVLANSVHLGFVRFFDAQLRCVAETAFAGAGCPWEFQCSLPQWRTGRRRAPARAGCLTAPATFHGPRAGHSWQIGQISARSP
jgi:hypothetical protein